MVVYHCSVSLSAEMTDSFETGNARSAVLQGCVILVAVADKSRDCPLCITSASTRISVASLKMQDHLSLRAAILQSTEGELAPQLVYHCPPPSSSK
jgi:hypothetical protein